MCGFVITSEIGGIDDANWHASMESLACRGPDDDQQVRLDNFRVGHRRLTVIGSSVQGRQPVVTADHILVFNGELYNYRQLASSLGIQAESDTQVLFEIVQRDLQEWLPKIRGMYAFVHVNRTTGELVAARDPFGIKPLYMHQSNSPGISLASTAGALALLVKGREADPIAVAHFLGWGFFPSERSAFSGISKLSPGTVYTWDRIGDQYTLRNTWPIPSGTWPLMPVSDAVRDSVEAHLVADVPVGVLLSGGVDSTLIAAMAKSFVPQLKTFSLTNPFEPSIDEAAIARHNAALIGGTHTEIPATPASLAQQIPALLESSGEPFADAAYLPLSLLCQEVAADVKVALAGEGADELFGGYRRYDLEHSFSSWGFRNFFQPLSRGLRLQALTRGKGSGVARMLNASVLPTAWDRHASLMYASWATVLQFLPGPTIPAIQESQESWVAAKADSWAAHLPDYQAFDLRVYLPNTYLEKSDRASMAHSLELRTPYLDPVIAKSAQNEPWMNSSKRVLRQTLHDQLPGVRLPKRKKGLSVNLKSVTSELQEPLTFVLSSRESVLQDMGLRDAAGLHEASIKDSSLGFRLAVLGAWQQTWL